MDIDEIRVGDTWPLTLDNALNTATVLLVVIGPTWLCIAGPYGRRRLDTPDDWVRTEIERSLTKVGIGKEMGSSSGRRSVTNITLL
jgi:hypothetical protein